ncbi:hypothetical protein F5X99DRAFT_60951 [Biscogniauxia marginata]|nr:hypothetical protein F5X99DRAFT_60951 [Biscogniauxia marginata]
MKELSLFIHWLLAQDLILGTASCCAVKWDISLSFIHPSIRLLVEDALERSLILGYRGFSFSKCCPILQGG